MKLYNTLTRHLDELTPLESNHVKLYTCGLTVYSQPHIGNWLPYIYWDVLRRVLRAEGLKVEHTQNFTDVGHLTSDDDSGEDKMEKGAHAEGVSAWDVAAKYIKVANDEAAQLGLLRPTHLVRATDMIDKQIDFATTLDKKGYLYEITNDGMYFDTSKLPKYGSLAKLDIDGLQPGTRVSIADKRNITDFAVWKFSPKNAKRDMEWDSPWGVGFPGWHLECSVIARETLGDQIDIHCGGIDHIPVHHINEIAQTEAVTEKQFSQFWVHSNHLKVNGRKMAKSLGNIYTLHDIMKRGFDVADFRFFVLSKHYRTEGNFTWDNLEAAANTLKSWRETAALVHQTQAGSNTWDFLAIYNRTLTLLKNDLGTVSAIAEINSILKNVSELHLTDLQSSEFEIFIEKLENLLGLKLKVPNISTTAKTLIGQRETARQNKDWSSSDRLRLRLLDMGIGLRDTPSGALWYWL